MYLRIVRKHRLQGKWYECVWWRCSSGRWSGFQHMRLSKTLVLQELQEKRTPNCSLAVLVLRCWKRNRVLRGEGLYTTNKWYASCEKQSNSMASWVLSNSRSRGVVVDHVIYGSSICLAWFMCAVYMSELQAVFLLASLLMENIYPLQFTSEYRSLSVSAVYF